MNIPHLQESNYGGSLHHILYVNVKNVDTAQWPERTGSNYEDEIILLPGETWKQIDFTLGSLKYKEIRLEKSGGKFYLPQLTGIIPKDRPDLIDIFENAELKRFIVLYKDANNNTLLIGNPDEPATFKVPSRDHKNNILARNEYEVLISTDSRERTPFYLAEVPVPPVPPSGGECDPSSINIYAINSNNDVVGSGFADAPINLVDTTFEIYVNEILDQIITTPSTINLTLNISA
jgi:hypothetical protein